MATRPDPWDRRPKESTPAFEAFVIYRGMGVERSIRRVAKELSKSEALLKRWSAEHGWALRVAAYDTHLDREYVNEVRAARRKTARRNAKLAGHVFDKLEDYAENLLSSYELDPAALARLAEVFGKLERTALGQGEQIDVTGGGGADLAAGAVATAAVLTDEDRRARLLMLQREVANRVGELPPPEPDPLAPDPDDPYAED